MASNFKSENFNPNEFYKTLIEAPEQFRQLVYSHFGWSVATFYRKIKVPQKLTSLEKEGMIEIAQQVTQIRASLLPSPSNNT